MVNHTRRSYFQLLALFFLLFSCFPGVMAQMVSFAEPNTISHKDVYVYSSNGTLLGLYNTTSTGIDISGQGDLVFMFKPQYSNPLDDPATFLDGAVSWFQTNALALIILGVMSGFLLKRW